VNLPIFYKDRQLEKFYIADLVIYGKIIVELKAVDGLISQFDAQLLNYLKATGLEVGLLINFGSPRLEYKRKVLTERSSIHSPSSIRGHSRPFAEKI
jgi:GxxExxY protein